MDRVRIVGSDLSPYVLKVRRSEVAGLRPAALISATLLAATTGVLASPDARPDASSLRLDLPEPRREGRMSLEQALTQRRSVRAWKAEPLPLAALSQLLFAAQGITDPRGLRTAPSAGALYPLEIFAVAGAVTGLDAGLYRYEPAGHRIERVVAGELRAALAGATWGQEWMAGAPLVLVIGAVPERASGKYGGRAMRYVHVEAGHAGQNVCLQAVALGLGSVVVGAFDDDRVRNVLGLPAEVDPLVLLPLGAPR